MTRKLSQGSYASEADLVERLVGMLRAGLTPFGPAEVATEWNYQSGMTDVLACTGDRELIAFEAKLRDWRKALHQAYRNTSFTRRAFVVLPANAALIASQRTEEFARHGVGLIAVSMWGLQVLVESPRRDGALLMTWMHNRALAHFTTSGHGERDGRFRFDTEPDLSPA